MSRLTGDIIHSVATTGRDESVPYAGDRVHVAAVSGREVEPALHSPTPQDKVKRYSRPPLVLPGAKEVTSMSRDYFYRVHVVPSAISVSNPVEDVPIQFSIWSAFPQSNELDNIVATGSDGLLLNFNIGDVWRGWEQKEDAGVIVTRQAPPVVSALFLFDFRLGDGELQFNAERATVITRHAEAPVIERLSWQTNVMRSLNGKVQRASVRRHPRRSMTYDIVSISEQELRELAATLAGKLSTPIILPIWAEPVTMAGIGVQIGGRDVAADVSLTEMIDGDTVWLESKDRSHGELARIASLNRAAGTVEFVDSVSNNYEPGDFIYPTIAALLNDGTTINRAQTEAGRTRLDATEQGRTPVVGWGATVDTYDGLPLLNRRPLIEGTAAESFAMNFERVDFGGMARNMSPDDLATVTRPRVYDVEGQADLQYFRAFLAAVRGRQGEFYAPTFRPNFVLARQPVADETELHIVADPDTFSFWIDLNTRRDIWIERSDGSGEIMRVSGIEDLEDGTLRAVFSEKVHEDGDLPIMAISMLERSRLGSDQIEIEHGQNGGKISLILETGRNDGESSP